MKRSVGDNLEVDVDHVNRCVEVWYPCERPGGSALAPLSPDEAMRLIRLLRKAVALVRDGKGEL